MHSGEGCQLEWDNRKSSFREDHTAPELSAEAQGLGGGRTSPLPQDLRAGTQVRQVRRGVQIPIGQR